MADQRTTIVDFVAAGSTPDEWMLVLVEEGPWPGAIDDQLRRVQERLYGCIDAALDGQLANEFSDTTGKDIVIRLDCYNVPEDEVAKFFDRFSKGIFAVGDYKNAIEKSKFVKSISFKDNYYSIH